MKIEKLIYMANQIGKFFESQGDEKAAAGIAEHIRKYWDPRMRDAIAAHLEAGGEGLNFETKRAIELIKDKAPAKSES